MHCDADTQMSAGKVAQSLVSFSHDDDGDGSGTALMAGSGILDLDGPQGNFGSFRTPPISGAIRMPFVSLATKNLQGGDNNFRPKFRGNSSIFPGNFPAQICADRAEGLTMATQSEVAAHLGIGQSAVAKLVEIGIFPRTPRRGLDLDQCRVAYLGRLREEAAGRAAQGDGEDLDLVTERARLAKEQADRISMENDITRREVVRSDAVVKILSPLLANLRTRLLAIPSECAVSLANVRSAASAEAIVRRVVIEALSDLSAGTGRIAEHCGAAPDALADAARPDASPAPARPKAVRKATRARPEAKGIPKGGGKPTKAAKATKPRKGSKS